MLIADKKSVILQIALHSPILFILVFIGCFVYWKAFQLKVVYHNEMCISCHVTVVFTTVLALEELWFWFEFIIKYDLILGWSKS